MTHPANKRRTHNAKARALGQKPHVGTGVRVTAARRSRYGQRLDEARRRREAK